jgi:CubicO group peptidase (beta-lactamase class C family)
MASNLKDNFVKHVEEKRLTGTSYAVSVNNEIKINEIIGYSDCAQTTPLQNNSMFRMASMTKPICTTAVLMCKDRGLLDLDAPISTYIDFHHSGVGQIINNEAVFLEEAREIRLRDVLSHSSGLGSGPIGNAQTSSIISPINPNESVEGLNGYYLDFKPGTRAAYSALSAFELAACAVEAVTQTPFDQFVKDEIFTPLGMVDTTFVVNDEQATRLVDLPLPDNQGHIEKIDIGRRSSTWSPEGFVGGSSGLFSTLTDYMKFANMLAFGGEINGRRYLSRESFLEMTSQQIRISDTTAWGLGVCVRIAKGNDQPLPVGCFGWSGAFGTHFFVDPSSKTACVLMLNHANCNGSESPFSKEFEKLLKDI